MESPHATAFINLARITFNTVRLAHLNTILSAEDRKHLAITIVKDKINGGGLPPHIPTQLAQGQSLPEFLTELFEALTDVVAQDLTLHGWNPDNEFNDVFMELEDEN